MAQTCPQGHEVREGLEFCTTCGTRMPDARRGPKAIWIIGAVGIVLLAGVAGFLLARFTSDGSEEASSDEAVAGSRSTTTEMVTTTEATTTTQAPTTTSAPTTTTIAPPPPLSPPEPSGPRFRPGAEIAHDAAVVHYTFGVAASDYPSFETLMSPEGRPQTFGQVLNVGYYNIDCDQIVSSISPVPSMSSGNVYVFEMRYKVNCHGAVPTDGWDPSAPLGSPDRGNPLPLEYSDLVEVTLGPAPDGGQWAVWIQKVP